MTALEVTDASVRFGGLTAVDGVSLEVPEGCIVGLIGPNGAGKTTLFNAITGLRPPDAGQVLLGGADVTNLPTFRRARRGLARTFQRLETFGGLSVRDNVRVAAEMRRSWADGDTDSEAATDDLLAQVGLDVVADELVATVPTGTARLVEIARALATQPSVLLLDEASSGLNETETQAIAKILRTLADGGLGVLLVEHDMPFVMALCEQLYVLDFGRLIAAGTPEEIRNDPVVQRAYLGERSEEPETSPARVRTEPVASQPAALELQGVHAGYGPIDVLHGIDLRVRAGEVYALLGPNGGGKTTTLAVAAGYLPATAGLVRMTGVPVNGDAPDALARAGVCLVPEGRGVFPNLTVEENLRLTTYTGARLADVLEVAFGRFPRLAERRKQLAGTMSGGEQQMLALSRALACDPAVLLIDELSMGLAPLVVQHLYEQIAEIATEGRALVIVEQFAHEVMNVADRAGIMLHGRITVEGDPDDIAGHLDEAYLGTEPIYEEIPS